MAAIDFYSRSLMFRATENDCRSLHPSPHPQTPNPQPPHSCACALVRAAPTQAVRRSGSSDSADPKRARRGSVDATESVILASDSDRLRTASRDSTSALQLGGDQVPAARPTAIASRGPPTAQSGRRQQKRKRTASTTRAAGTTATGNSQREMSKNLSAPQQSDLPPDAIPVPYPGKTALAG